MIKAVLIWYDMYTEVLLEMGFKVNPYDKCMANKMINNKQCSIGWYVDNNKISRVEEAVCTNIVNAINFQGELTRTTGNSHTLSLEWILISLVMVEWRLALHST